MTKEDGLIIGGVVLGGALVIYLVSSKKSTVSLANTNLAATGGLISGIGSLAGGLGKLLGGGASSNTGRPPAAYGSTAAPNSSGPGPIGVDSQGFFTVDDSEIGNVTGYDSQDGTVYGIAGLDYAD